MTIRVLVADDQAMIRGALAGLLNLEHDIEVVAQAADGVQVLEELTRLTRQNAPLDAIPTSSARPVSAVDVVKNAPVEALAEGVRTLAAGGRAIDQSLAVEALSTGSSSLTQREADVLREVERGGTIADIARTLGLSQGTVRNHVSSAMLKMEARTRAEAASLARAAGWL